MHTSPESALKGQTVLLTGAGSGIGRAAAHLLAADGAHLVLVGRRAPLLEAVAAEITAAGGRALTVPAAVDDRRQVDKLVGRVRDEVGPVDVLINNAGSVPEVFNVLWVDDLDWQRMLEVNLNAVFRLTQAVLPDMLSRAKGTIITVTSVAALRPSLFSGPAYGAAKAGASNFMAYLNSAFGNDGIRATSIMPGEVNTTILDGRVVPPPDDQRDLMIQPEDVARAVHLAASLPQRTVIPKLVIVPRQQRNRSAELAGNRRAGQPVDLATPP